MTVRSQPTPWIAADRTEVTERARSWLASPALVELAHRLDGPSDPGRLLAWSRERLDTRGGRERRDVDQVMLSDGSVRALVAAAHALGLFATATAAHDRYDQAIVLGGATTGNRLRVQLAHALSSRGVTFGTVTGLAADRLLGAREHETDPDSTGDATEWRNLQRRLEEAFGPLERTCDRQGEAWRDDRYASAAGQTVRILVAPSSRPDRRADTADALRFFLCRVAPGERHTLLLITSAIYAPYQFFAAAPLLLADDDVSTVELVGTPTSRDTDSPLLAQRLAQEIHAGIESACRLLEHGRESGR